MNYSVLFRSGEKKSRTVAVGLILLFLITVTGIFFSHWLTEPLAPAPVKKDTESTIIMSAEMDSLFTQAVEQMQSGRYEQALIHWRKALLIDPSIPEVKVNIGFTLFNLGDIDSACQFFNEAIAQNAYQANAYYGLAICFEQFGDLSAALGAMRSFVHLAQPQHKDFLNRARSAIWEWEAALQSVPDDKE